VGRSERDYRLIKEVWAFTDDRIAVRFAMSAKTPRAPGRVRTATSSGSSTRGLMRRREASINDVPIDEADRLFHWPLGRRPDDHPGLTALGL
jgi:nuclear transport factor 2 (NTF2) superfamily protein